MGQFLDYLASMFASSNNVEASKEKSSNNNRVTFAENSFTQVFTKNEQLDKVAKFASLSQSNRNTIYLYQIIGALSFLAHFSMVAVPRIRLESFDILESDSWHFVTLSLVPFIVYLASIGAMNEVNKPISEATKLTAKNSSLDLNSNEFINSLKIIILLMSMCQVSAILFSDELLWSVVMIVPFWCYQLTSKVARIESTRYSSSPKKQWVNKLNISRSPKQPSTPPPSKTTNSTTSSSKQDNGQVRATPRTRTKRAVKNIITGVTDKYHAFEQNVAHQLSQKIFTPLSPKLKMIE